MEYIYPTVNAVINLRIHITSPLSTLQGMFCTVECGLSIYQYNKELAVPGPYLRTGQRGPGPGRKISRGGILKKSRLKCEKKKGCPRERN
jgi:hypothetical protein